MAEVVFIKHTGTDRYDTMSHVKQICACFCCYFWKNHRYFVTLIRNQEYGSKAGFGSGLKKNLLIWLNHLDPYQ